jgi:hypothetical protein
MISVVACGAKESQDTAIEEQLPCHGPASCGPPCNYASGDRFSVARKSPISGDFRAVGGAAKNKPKQASGSCLLFRLCCGLLGFRCFKLRPYLAQIKLGT